MFRKILSIALLLVFSAGFAAQHLFARNSIRRTTKLSLGNHFAEVNGIEFHYVVAGHGPLVVVQAPGWGIGSAYLQNGLAPLEKSFTLLFYDPRGSGASTRPSSRKQMGTSNMVDDLEHLRKYWGLESIDVLGHSSGGAIALGYAERYPERVKKLILVDSQLVGYNPIEAQQMMEARRNDPRYKSALVCLNQPTANTDEAFGKQLACGLPYYLYDPAKYLQPALKTLGTGDPSSWAFHAWQTADRLSPMPQTALLKKVQARTLIIVGREDAVCPPAVAERIHAGIPHSTLMIYERDGHFPWIERPNKFFSDTSSFLNR